jgi:NTP pyrophosphatase (non-canonical NTP hydrolase)
VIFAEEEKDKIRTITKTYTFGEQREILVEECAELIQAVQKLKRKERCVIYPNDTTATQNFIEELADVTIMVEQMVYYLTPHLFSDYACFITQKLDRQIKRINSEVNHEQIDKA